MYSVELLPDAELAAEVRRLWRLLADAGLPSLANHGHPTNRPHVTVGLTGDLAPVRADLARVVLPALPVEAVVADVTLFAGPRRNTLVLELHPGPALVALHEQVWRVLTMGHPDGMGHPAGMGRPAGTGQPSPHLAPGAWRPHLTLALRLRHEQTGAALALLSPPHARQLTGSLVGARCYDTVTRRVDELVPADGDVPYETH